MGRKAMTCKNDIIRVTAEIFNRFGYTRTTMKSVARALHVSKSALYVHFSGKEAIFRSIVEREKRNFREQFKASAFASDDPRSRIRAFIIVHFRHVRRMANTYSIMHDAYLKHYRFVQVLCKDIDIFEINLLRDILNDGCRKGVFGIPGENFDLVAQAIMLTIRGFAYEWSIKRLHSSVNITEKIDALLSIFEFGIVTSRIAVQEANS